MRHAATVRLVTVSPVLWALLPTPFLPGPTDSTLAGPVERLLDDVDLAPVHRVADAVGDLADVLPDPTPRSGR